VSRRTLLIGGFVAFGAVIMLIAAIEIPRQQRLLREARDRAKHERAQNAFQVLKGGSVKYPVIDSPELMSMIANDPPCALQLTYVHFDATDLNASEFQQFQKLHNVTVISFYDCEGIESLLGYAANMPSVNKIYFFCARPTDSLLKQLASIPNLKTIKFNDVFDGDLDIFRRALPHMHFEVGDD
jgi:hypothetical protein